MATTWTTAAAVLTAEASNWEGNWTLATPAGQAAVNMDGGPCGERLGDLRDLIL